MKKRRIRNKRKRIYLVFAILSIMFFYISINVLYGQTSSFIYDEDIINNLPNAERFVKNIKISTLSTNNNIVVVEWEGIKDNNLIYYLYRSNSPIIGKSSLVDSYVVDYIKATNDSKSYSILDRPILSAKYYYAVVSYVDDLSFYSAKENVDMSAINFNGLSYNNQNNNIESQYNNIDNNANNFQYSNTFITNIYTNTVFSTNNVTNTYTLTNIYSVTNIYSFTNTITNRYNITNNFSANTSSGIKKNNNSSGSSSGSIEKYNSDYYRALAEFKKGNYSSAASILEPISKRNINKDMYYKINLLLGKSYKYMKRKKNALDVFNRIKNYNTQEVNFWINQVLSDL